MLPMLLLLACSSAPDRHHPGTLPQDRDSDRDEDSQPAPGPCPAGMALVEDRVCVDRFEASLEVWNGANWEARCPYEALEDGEQVRAVVAEGAVPQGYISGDEAESACVEAGKRLCEDDEWLAACRGPQGWTWPYGDDHVDGACNDVYDGSHPVIDWFGTSEGVWDTEYMNDPGINQQPGTVAPGGDYTDCESAWGVFDLHGNLHEWVVDPDGTFRGGFYADASINGPGCSYVTTAHGRGYHDYSTGFRCCADPE